MGYFVSNKRGKQTSGERICGFSSCSGNKAGFEYVATDTLTRRMQMLRHHIVSPLLSLLLIAGLAVPSLHTISHVVQEPYIPYETEQAGTPVFDTEGCELCVLTATLVGVELEAISVSPAYAVRQHSASASHLVYALLSAPTDARAPPATA